VSNIAVKVVQVLKQGRVHNGSLVVVAQESVKAQSYPLLCLKGTD
jgi:hypothetical protein